MGIDFTHCDASWSYGNFHRARVRLAETIGIKMDEMLGFGGNQEWNAAVSPLVILLDHSDCDGELSPDECRLVAPALRKAVEPWPDGDSDKRRFLELANGMDAAAEANEPLEFT